MYSMHGFNLAYISISDNVMLQVKCLFCTSVGNLREKKHYKSLVILKHICHICGSSCLMKL